MDIGELQRDAPGIKYYTSLGDYNMFICVLASLGPGAYSFQYWNNINPSIRVQNQLLLALMELWRCSPTFELSWLF